MSIDLNQILAILQHYEDPYLKQDLLSAKRVKSIDAQSHGIVVTIDLGYPARGFKDTLVQELKEQFLQIAGMQKVHINVTWQIARCVTRPGLQEMPEVKNIIAIASAKGGVGKSTTAVNLALALQQEGASVGILDADIYGPNQPHMLGVAQKTPQGKLEPVMAHGIQSISMGYLVDSNTPMIWRGPLVTQALQQLLFQTVWQALDYLIIDLPPGTGDVQLTLAQKIPVSGAVIVTTPQDIAVLDARKGLEMFRKVNIPVLGVIENMSVFVCPSCGHEETIFGSGGALRLAEECDTELLGSLPLDRTIREQADSGKPTVSADPHGTIAERYRKIARRLVAKLSLQPSVPSAQP